MADYTLDQLKALWEEGSQAGRFAPLAYNTALSPEGEGGGGQTYEAYGSNPNSILVESGDRNYSMPTLTRLSDEEGGGYRVVTDQLGGAEHVTYSPEGKVIDRKWYENPEPSHQGFFKRFLPIVAGGALASSLTGAGAVGSAGTGGFGIAPETVSSLFGSSGGGGAAGIAGLTTPAELATLGELGINTGLAPGTAGGMYGSAAGAAELASLGELGINTGLAPGTAGGVYGPASVGSALSAEGAATAAGLGGELHGPLIDSTIPPTYGTEVAGSAAGAAGAAGSGLASGAGKGIVDLLTDPRVLAAVGAGAAGAAAANKGRDAVAPVGLKSIPQYTFNREALPIDTTRQPGKSPAQRYFKDSYTKLAAGGGIAGLPRNEYKAGGRYLSGPGDGMSDNIKANIDGVQEARLADGEFVIPADVVSHIGNGSSNAGAKRLHTMMARIRKARTGNPKQGKQIKPEKYLPA